MSQEKLLSRIETAVLCGVGLALFDKDVRPKLREKKIGRRVLFRPKDVQAWLETDKDGESAAELREGSGTSASKATVISLSDPRVQEIAMRLNKKRLASTRTPSLSKSQSPSSARASTQSNHSRSK